MRRQDKEQKDAAFLDGVLRESEIMCLALNTGGVPYAVFVHFIYKDGALFVHGANEGRKLDLLRADPRVGFTTAMDVRIVPEKFTTHYRSVSGTGVASFIDDPEEKQVAFAGFADKYQASCPRPVPENMARRMSVVRIDITSLAGKQSPAGP